MASSSPGTYLHDSLPRLWYAAMQCAWLAAIVSMLDGWLSGEPYPWMIWACLVYPATYAWARVCLRLGWRFAIEGVGGVVIGFTVLIACMLPLVQGYTWQGLVEPLEGLDIRRLWILFIIWLFAWLRGWWLSRAEVGLARMSTAVHWQLGLMMAFIVPACIEDAGFKVNPWLLGLFFISAMVGFWLARSRESEQRRELGSTTGGYFSLAVGFALVFGIGLALWAAVDKDLLGVLKGPALWTWQAIETAIESIGHAFAWILALMVAGAKKPGPSPLGLEKVDQALLAQQQAVHSEKAGGVILISIFFIVLTVILIVAVVAGIRALLARMRSKEVRIPPRHKGRINFSFFGNLWRSLVGLAKWLLGLPGAVKKRLNRPAPDTMVQYYRGLQKWGAKGKRPRGTDQTPDEYLATLVSLAPARSDDLTLITESYVRSRYGPPTKGEMDLAEVGASWQRVKRTNPKTKNGKRRLKSIKRALKAASR